MGLRDIILGGVDTAFKIVDDLLTEIEYFSYESSSADATTGVITTRYVNQVGVKVLYDNYERREVDGDNIQSQDKRVSIPFNNIKFVPKPKDKLREDNGQEWRVVDFDRETDPARAMYILQCRRII